LRPSLSSEVIALAQQLIQSATSVSMRSRRSTPIQAKNFLMAASPTPSVGNRMVSPPIFSGVNLASSAKTHGSKIASSALASDVPYELLQVVHMSDDDADRTLEEQAVIDGWSKSPGTRV
jgi:hypothetical protein